MTAGPPNRDRLDASGAGPLQSRLDRGLQCPRPGARPFHEPRNHAETHPRWGIVAVVLAESGSELVRVVRALAEGGVTAAEITFTVPDAIEVIRQVRREFGDAIVLGAGTVLDPETARAALLAGAEYIVAPTVNIEVIRLCRRYDKVGCLGH